MRVTSALWVSALLRRAFGSNMPALVARRGAEEAGAIFVAIDRIDGTLDLYGPAPQTAFTTSEPELRLFQQIRSRVAQKEVDESIAKEARFDPDIWLVVIEDRAGRVLFDLASEPTGAKGI
jgi:hypothetical protein